MKKIKFVLLALTLSLLLSIGGTSSPVLAVDSQEVFTHEEPPNPLVDFDSIRQDTNGQPWLDPMREEQQRLKQELLEEEQIIIDRDITEARHQLFQEEAFYETYSMPIEEINSMASSAEEPAAFTGCASVDVPESECLVLVDLYNSTNGPSWYDNTDWLETDQVCTWYGIGCSVGSVVEISLMYNNLFGDLSTDFTNLSNLVSINLNTNSLTGDFSTIVGHLPVGLEYLNFRFNQIGGTIPTEISNFTNLYFFNVGGNQLTGNLATIIPNLPLGLTDLYMFVNQFTGTIPASIGNLTNLTGLSLSTNQLTGDMGAVIDNLPTGIQYVRMARNQFTGTIPASTTDLTSLYQLDLSENQLTGDMTTVINNLPVSIGELIVYLNDFTGTIPSSVDGLTNLVILDVGDNQLTGDLTTIIPTLPTSLEVFACGNNQFTGTIPSGISSFINLIELEVSANQLTGNLTTIIPTLPSSLQRLGLGWNSFTGSIPTGVGSLSNLVAFNVAGNGLSGDLTTIIGYLPTLLEYLYLENNNFTGTIPADIADLTGLLEINVRENTLSGDLSTIIGYLPTGLEVLNLSFNTFTGTITSDISNFTNLYFFNVGGNQLTGNLATIIPNFPLGLTDLYMFVNQFTGTIPASIGNLTNLTGLSLSTNQLTGDMGTIIDNLPTGIQYVRMARNQFTGTIPASISDLTSLYQLDVSENQLTGDLTTVIDNLPTSIGELIVYLNNFTGTIPSSVASLTNLVILDVGDNQLTGDLTTIIPTLPTSLEVFACGNNQFTGTIPAFISSFTTLRDLDISNNSALSGTVPLSITLLPLEYFDFRSTNLCEPDDPSYDSWKAGVINYYPGVCVNVEPPTNLSATTISQTQIDLTWTDNAADETEYQVYRSPDGYNHWVLVETLAANSISYSDTGLQCNFEYFYKVVAHRSTPEESSSASNKDNATTSACSSRRGGWLDTITMSVVNPGTAVTQIGTGAIDLYAGGLGTPADFAAIEAAGLDHSEQTGLYYDLTLNPVGPVFTGTGKLNPFASPVIREAMNWLIDRDYLNTTVYGGYGTPKWVPMVHGFPEYNRYITEIQTIESFYAYNQSFAASTIAAEMTNLGATMVNGNWQYQGEDVVLTFLIRTDSDGTRLPMGNIIADWLEDIGFTVDRHYGTSSELSTLWLFGDPNDGLWHLYTGAWGLDAISRDDSDYFQFFYSQNSAYSSVSPLWASYNLSPADLLVVDALANQDFADLAARDALFADAFNLIFDYNYRIWLIDGAGQSPWKTDLDVSYNLATGVYQNAFWPHTLRYEGSAGGNVKWANADLNVDPVNPVAGSNWTYDAQWQLATSDWDAIPHPSTGLPLAQRIDYAEVVVETGLPVTKTKDWVTLSTQPTITVPTDAWADWDAGTQTFLTVGDLHPGGLNAAAKITLHYPSELWHIKWHDGSPLTLADFIMALIVKYDRSKAASAIYDASYEGVFWYKAVKIVTEDPLVVEIYTDSWNLDAEMIAVANKATFWPEYGSGQAPWHVIAISNSVEADGNLAYSPDKADALAVEWTNYLGGPGLALLQSKMNTLATTPVIPYAPTLSNYITIEEVALRYQNLQSFYGASGHFWVGTGPYMLSTIDWVGKTLQLVDNPDYIDPADKWSFCYPLTLSHTGNGSDPVASPSNSTGCATGEYVAGEAISLSGAAPDTGWEISGWTGTSDDASTAITNTLVMPNKAHSASVVYTPSTYTLTVNVVGSGSVGKLPDKSTYTYNEVVSLTATADPGWTFAGWSGDLSGTANPDTITMDGNKTVTATFTQDEYTLTVSVVGSGSVGKLPDKSTYTYNDVVELTATADPGWIFTGWSGDLSGTTNPKTITMNGNKTVTATFIDDSRPKDKPILIAPTGSITQQSPTYSWNEVSDATWYLLVVKKDGTQVVTWLWKSAASICSGGTCTVTPGKLLGAGNYSWWVMGKNDSGNGPWSQIGNFTIEGKPDRPALYAPELTIYDQTPTYSWEDVYSAEFYLLVVKKDGTQVVTWLWKNQADICTGGFCEVDPGKKLGAGHYTFWVVAKNSAGFGFWSMPGNYTLEGTPDQPALYYPTGTIPESAPEFDWQHVYSATQYVLVVRDSGSNVEVWTTYNAADICSADFCGVIPVGLVLPDDSYTWQVLPKNSYGNGFWSLIGNFTVTTP